MGLSECHGLYPTVLNYLKYSVSVEHFDWFIGAINAVKAYCTYMNLKGKSRVIFLNVIITMSIAHP